MSGGLHKRKRIVEFGEVQQLEEVILIWFFGYSGSWVKVKLLTRYCKLIGHKYSDHICSKCNGEDNVIPDVQLE
ncbi:hypothetical protein H5410_005462 [Solanum commersonii]|uniref:Uncharacterized protein n=1 Tax=Solanum commersonii TaxID=4109 RepID=A0A9J6A7M5_SOLCO|nr:hypothetical protein H5410_005462 [Solanum commersonii]